MIWPFLHQGSGGWFIDWQTQTLPKQELESPKNRAAVELQNAHTDAKEQCSYMLLISLALSTHFNLLAAIFAVWLWPSTLEKHFKAKLYLPELACHFKHFS